LTRNGNHPKRKARAENGVLAAAFDRHVLYEASVQCVEADIDFFQRLWRAKHKRPLRRLKEDFCGTAALAAEFVRRHPENRAWGVDLHRPTLDWGRKHHLAPLGDAASRVRLLKDDVRKIRKPRVEMVAALNFSYSVFKTREELRRYFKSARASLAPGGVFVVDSFGGSGAMEASEEPRRIPASVRRDGTRIPAFTYIWDQSRFNTITHEILCHIHFRFRDGSMRRRAFTYDWRLWTLPELREIMAEAGFSATEVYMEGWDDDEDEADGIFRRRTFFENMEGWVGYVVGMR